MAASGKGYALRGLLRRTRYGRKGADVLVKDANGEVGQKVISDLVFSPIQAKINWIIVEATAAPVQQDQTGSYSVYSAVSSDRTETYSVYSSVLSDRTETYGVYSAVSSDRTETYVVGDSVITDQVGSYSVYNSVLSDRTETYGVYSAVSSDRTGSYLVYQSATQDHRGTYPVYTRAAGAVENYTGVTGVAFYAGISATAPMPAWRTAMAPNTWVAISAASLSDVDPKYSSLNPNGSGATAPWSGTTGQATIPDAWGSMWVSPDGVVYIGGGANGGHSNYAGNEFYKFDATQASPEWVLVRPPSGAVGNTITLDDSQEATGLYSDGRLRAVHTYNNIVYVPNHGPVIYRHGTSTFSGGQSGTENVWTIDVETGEALGPSASIDNAGLRPGGGYGSFGSPYGACAYDPTRNRIYGMGAVSSACYLTYAVVGTAGAVWTAGYLGADQQGIGSYGALVYLPTLDRLLMWTGSSYAKFIDPSDGSYVMASFTGSAPTGLVDQGAAGIDWCPTLGKLLVWNNDSATTTIATLTLGATEDDPITWGTLTLSGSNAVTPPIMSGNGTFGKFKVCESLKGCFLLPPDVSDPMYFFAFE